jgi:branched-chain amino acid transport system ATP-binding protein
MTSQPAIQVEDVCVSYGPAIALSDVSLSIAPGSCMAILGRNGAGKSSLAAAIGGMVKPTRGRIVAGGTDITQLPAYQRRRRGVIYLPEGRAVFGSLSVQDNLRMSVRCLDRGDRQAALDRMVELFPVLGRRAQQRADTLSGGERQQLALARAMVSDPVAVIADEPSLGLAPKIMDSVFETLEVLREAGVALLLIEQMVHRALRIADSCVILRRGEVAWQGSAADAADSTVSYYLGE